MGRGTAHVIRTMTATAITAFFVAIAAPVHAEAEYPSDARLTNEARTRGERTTHEGDAPEHFRVGPMVALGFPRPFSLEAFAKIEKIVGVGAEYSFLPPVNAAGVDASFKAIAADLRVFPFKGAFFIGARAGRQWLDARAKISAGEYGSFSETMAASTWFVNPRLGFLVTFRSGVTVGIDAGVQLPLSPTYERRGLATDSGLAAGTSTDKTLALIAGTLGNNVTPTIDLLRLGFLF